MNEDNEPKAEDIKKYVAIGPTPEYSLSVYKSTFDTGFILFTIIFGAALIAIVVVTIIWANSASKLDDPPPGLPLNNSASTSNITNPNILHSNYGAVRNASLSVGANNITSETECLANKNGKWVNDHCECKVPYYGKTCQLEKHDAKYFSVGVPDDNSLQLSVINGSNTKNKSFNEEYPYNNNNTCSDYCDKNSNCIGFLYESNNCLLLTDNVIVQENTTIPYSPIIESTLYLKSSDNLHFKNKIFLGAYLKSFPPRYWLFKESPGYIQFETNTITELKFFPEHIKVYTKDDNLTGIYALHPFLYKDIYSITQYGDTSQFYIHNTGYSLNIPVDWKNKLPLYVIYF